MCVLPSLQVTADTGRHHLPNDPATLDIGQYAAAPGIAAPWKVSDVNLDPAQRMVDVIVRHEGADLCPVCGQAAGEV